jgi:hypothetical protein
VDLRQPPATTENPMTDDRIALVELLQKSRDGDFLRAVTEAVVQILMEADVEGLIGVGRNERTADRLNYRNGYRDRSLETRLGTLSLEPAHPEASPGQLFPAFLEPRKTAEKGARHSDPGGPGPGQESATTRVGQQDGPSLTPHLPREPGEGGPRGGFSLAHFQCRRVSINR